VLSACARIELWVVSDKTRLPFTDYHALDSFYASAGLLATRGVQKVLQLGMIM